MPPATPDELRLMPLGEEHGPTIARLIRDHGIDGCLAPCRPVTASAHERLSVRIMEDAARDDSVALVALRGGEASGVVVLRFPRWDAEHFGFPVGRVEHLQGRSSQDLQRLVEEATRVLRARGAKMCSARLSNDALPALHCLERCGFRYVELVLSPGRDLTTWQPREFGVTRQTTAQDLDRVCSIARAAFRTDRFHRDPRFERSAADGIYEKWVRTWHAEPSMGRFSRVLLLEGEIAGFFLFEVVAPPGAAQDAVARIVLNGVDPAITGRGHGFRMYCDALDAASRVARHATADIAAANPAVINLYTKLGFTMSDSGQVTMHWWA